ncbi:hypothetical protein, conserved [Babesia bigemina]|uniref:Uncharacterized protein n=1 Tax=Babesia bigemina TaxID=5866 RepID=A0A061DBN0_BABBI|nr:hypothetical protein, conserved [Babesia bigemina]CDR95155.1 hypothetical protein, conserved [Babesia bigemina]|eukprot:XP_012767341.1 hypothetical protein, conserved [Babesia bigemina]
MSRVFVKQAPRLVRQHLPLVQTLSASAVVDALEDAANLRHRDSYVEEFILRCESRALALLPDLRLSGIVRSLFALKRANVRSGTFADEVARFLLEECATGKLYDGFLDCCTANDLLLLYKAFAVVGYFNVRLYTLCMGLLATQTPHMIPADCCVFFQSHVKYVEALKSGGFHNSDHANTPEMILCPSLATEITLRFLQQDDATPEDLTVFAEWLVRMGDYYGISDELSGRVAALHRALSPKAVMFSVDHIHRLVQSTCKIKAHMEPLHLPSSLLFIQSLLHEAERRSDIHTYENALATLHAVEDMATLPFELVSGLLYTVVNNVGPGDAERVRGILRKRIQGSGTDEVEFRSVPMEYKIDTCPPAVVAVKVCEPVCGIKILQLREMLERLDISHRISAT